ncbi:MAG TPA: hypothetical protein VNG35_07090, partial [Gemmatimonadales bacterium]|nr:hypothetical protein [Gemmatimonadales bacterium]
MSTDDTAIAVREQAGIAALEHVLGTGDLAQLSNTERVGHYLRVCRSLGLNPLSRPFDWIFFRDPDGTEKLQLYPNQSCAAQLRRQHQIRLEVTRRETIGEMFVVEVKATTPDGREDFASKYVPLTNKYGRLNGQQYANALMKAETGAKRRATFSMVGLALPPDTDDGGAWRPVVVDGTGMIVRHPTPEQQYLAATPTAARAIGEPVFEDSGIAEDDLPSQAARPEELERPRRSGPLPTFRPTKEQVDAWQRAFFAAVTSSSLDSDDARHRYVEQYSCSMPGWPVAKQTDSLPTFLARCTPREAE